MSRRVWPFARAARVARAIGAKGIIRVQHREYEVVLSQRESLARIHAAERAIKRAGGRVMLKPSMATGLVLVTLVLPEPLTPKQFFPDLPFYAV